MNWNKILYIGLTCTLLACNSEEEPENPKESNVLGVEGYITKLCDCADTTGVQTMEELETIADACREKIRRDHTVTDDEPDLHLYNKRCGNIINKQLELEHPETTQPYKGIRDTSLCGDLHYSDLISLSVQPNGQSNKILMRDTVAFELFDNDTVYIGRIKWLSDCKYRNACLFAYQDEDFVKRDTLSVDVLSINADTVVMKVHHSLANLKPIVHKYVIDKTY